MRNLLEEFNEDHGVRPPTILGVREHIFTGRWELMKAHESLLQMWTACFSSLDSFQFFSNFFCILVQCILFSLVYVKPRNKLCHNRSKSFSKPTEVSSFLFAWMRLRVINICFKPSISDCIAFYLYTSNCKCFYIGNVVSNINRSDTQSDVPYHLSRNFKCLHPCFLTYNIRSQFHPKRERNKRSERKTHK